MMQSKPKKDSFVTVSGVRYYHSEVFLVVDTFYKSVSTHPSLKVPFKSVYDWPEHIERMTQFWWIRFGGRPYMFSQYNPVLKHYYAGFNKKYLSEWLELFHQTLDIKLTTKQASMWKNLSKQMGIGLLARNEMIRAQKSECL